MKIRVSGEKILHTWTWRTSRKAQLRFKLICSLLANTPKTLTKFRFHCSTKAQQVTVKACCGEIPSQPPRLQKTVYYLVTVTCEELKVKWSVNKKSWVHVKWNWISLTYFRVNYGIIWFGCVVCTESDKGLLTVVWFEFLSQHMNSDLFTKSQTDLASCC